MAPSVLAFYTAEALAVHALLDAAGVPRTAGGEAMSLSQRVAEALRLLRVKES